MKKLFLYLAVWLLFPLFACGQSEGINVGDTIYEITGDTPDGKTITLSSLKGKIVLVDFWASWCQPCRMENPALKKAYAEYKNTEFSKGSGFDIFSISLDRKKNEWTKAIEKDQLAWDNHICDFKEWYSALVDQFELKSIPANFLIDKDGIIIAKDLRGNALEKTLQALKK